MNSFWPTWKENPLVAALITVVLVILAIFLGLRAWNMVAEHGAIGRVPIVRDTISIEGQGKVTATPDIARVELGVYSEGTDVQRTQTDNTKKINAILDAIKKAGVSADDMQTSNYAISPKYNWDNGRQTLIGYTVSQNVTIKVRDLKKVGDILTQAGALGANQINGVTFSVDDPSKLQQQARTKAIEDARSKANELADALGLKVTRVVDFSEASSQPGYPIPMMAKQDAAMGMGGAASVPDIQSGSLDITSNVSVTFEIQ
ncbi:MAG: SIMPL domain-containing protein [bacterium]|nr:SIMPL domain-containing protein [bacterium]